MLGRTYYKIGLVLGDLRGGFGHSKNFMPLCLLLKHVIHCYVSHWNMSTKRRKGAVSKKIKLYVLETMAN